jgi:hypothetical protein
MGIAYDYLTRRHSAAYADAIELDRVNTDIKRMEDQLEKVTNELEGARVYAGVLTSSIEAAQHLVEDECKRNDWPLPEPPAEPPAPAPIADRITRETTGTLAFEAIKVASPTSGEGGGIVCGNPGCGLELIHENGVFIHTATGMNTCKAEPPALLEGMEGSPLQTTVLPPHGVEVTREDA